MDSGLKDEQHIFEDFYFDIKSFKFSFGLFAQHEAFELLWQNAWVCFLCEDFLGEISKPPTNCVRGKRSLTSPTKYRAREGVFAFRTLGKWEESFRAYFLPSSHFPRVLSAKILLVPYISLDSCGNACYAGDPQTKITLL